MPVVCVGREANVIWELIFDYILYKVYCRNFTPRRFARGLGWVLYGLRFLENAPAPQRKKKKKKKKGSREEGEIEL
jgi:hypothetical protein